MQKQSANFEEHTEHRRAYFCFQLEKYSSRPGCVVLPAAQCRLQMNLHQCSVFTLYFGSVGHKISYWKVKTWILISSAYVQYKYTHLKMKK